ncbi:MAG: hypothetical protein CMH55_10925 [Myxococcales bacterium]|nr:hypothetical protein [Myxococcales bacterium]
MLELCVSLVLVLDPAAPFAAAATAAAKSRPCTKVLTITGSAEADRAQVGGVKEQAVLVAYGPAAAVAVVTRWPDRSVTLGGLGPANSVLFEAPHRRVLPLSPEGHVAIALANRLLPSRKVWCVPVSPDMARDRVERSRSALRQAGMSLVPYRDAPPAGCEGLVAWYEGPATTADGFQTLLQQAHRLKLPVLAFSPELLGQGTELAVGVQLGLYLGHLLDGGSVQEDWLLWVDPVGAARKGLAWPKTWPNVPVRIQPPE